MDRQRKLIVAIITLTIVLVIVSLLGYRSVRHNNLIYQGSQKHHQGDIKGAEKIFLEAVDSFPNSAEAHFSLATVYLAQKKSKAADNEFKKAINLDPNKAEYYAYQGYLYFNQLGKRREAIKHMEKAILLEPKNYQYHLALGYFYKKFEETKKAIAEFDKVLKLAPELNMIRDELVELYHKLGDTEKAAKIEAQKAKYPDESTNSVGRTMQGQ